MKAVKVGTQLDPDLLRRAKICAARRGKKLREVFEESLEAYLSAETGGGPIGSIRESWGALKLTPKQLKDLMAAPLWYETE